MKLKLRRGPDEVVSEGFYILDQISETSDIWIHANAFNNYLKDTYKLTPLEYLCILYFDNKDYRENLPKDKCFVCYGVRKGIEIESHYPTEFKLVKPLTEKGKFKAFGHYQYDHISRNPELILSRNFSLYLKYHYNITLSQYWNICNGFDKDEKHYCKYCGAELQFSGLGNGGFSEYCGLSCHDLMMWQNPEYRKERLNDYIAAAIRDFKGFISKMGTETPSEFYISSLYGSDHYKFGITTTGILARSQSSTNVGLLYKSIHLIRKGSALEIAALEYLIKINFKLNREVINPSLLHSILNFIRFYKFNDYRNDILSILE